MPSWPERFVGQIVPSANRTVERTTEALLARASALGACYARIAYRPDPSGYIAPGYDLPDFRAAAGLLADAGVAAISWNGTKGAVDGFEVDRDLCAALAKVAGCPVTTVALDALTILSRLGAARIGLLTQGDLAHAEETARQFGMRGHETVAIRALGARTNLEGAALPPERLAAAVRELHADARPEAVLIWGTNMRGLSVAAALEAELAIPVIDSSSIGLWGCLAALDMAAPALHASGSIFRLLG